MLRTRAVRRLLVEDVAGIHLPGAEEEEPDQVTLEEALEGAPRRALVVSGLLALGLVFLLASRPPGEPFFVFRGTDTVFSLAALAVAGYAGFRLAQWRNYGTIRRALAELPPEAGEPE